MHRILTLLTVCLATLSFFSANADNNLEYTLKRAKNLQEKRDFAASSQLLDRYIDNYFVNPTKADSLKMVEILTTQGDNFYYLGVLSRAAELFEQALKIAEATGQTRKVAQLCNELFVIYLNSGNSTLSNDLLNRSLDLYRSLNDTVAECKVLNNIGILRYKEGQIEKSLEFYNKSLKIAGNDSAIRSTIITNIAESYTALEDYKTADKWLDQALDLRGRRYDNSDGLQAWLNKAAIQSILGNKDNARRILSNVGDKISLMDADRLIEAYKRISETYMITGDSVKGLRWLLKANEMEDSIKMKEQQGQLRELIVRYNSERISEHNRILELDVRRHTQLNYVMIILILVALSFMIFLILKIRSDRRKNRLIREQREQLLEFERIEHDRKERDFREQLDYKNRQLTAYSIDAASISELHKILIDSLKQLRISGGESVRTEINDIILRLQNFNRKEVNEDFRVYFNEVHPDFLKRLSERFPALTQNDLRLSRICFSE